MLKIFWDIQVHPDAFVLDCMRMAAEKAVECEGILLPCAVSVCLCDDETIAGINRTYRNIESSTDVLSFPTVSYPQGKTAVQCENLIRNEYDDESKAYQIGEIFISVPHMKAQADEYGHSELREGCYLLVHGLCHLFGYDHIKTEDKERMRSMEEKILSAVSIPFEDTGAIDDQKLLQLAREAMKRSYSPYSRFPVGAALLSKDGRIFLGCNIENASFSMTMCAERTAVFKAVSEGATKFSAIAIAAKAVAWPCGACRQVLNEFAPDIRVLVTWDDQTLEKNLNELLPENFGPKNLEQ